MAWVPTAAGDEAGKGTELGREVAGWMDQEHEGLLKGLKQKRGNGQVVLERSF